MSKIPYRTITVEVEARVYEPDTLFFRQELATATTTKGREYQVSCSVGGGAVLVWGGSGTEWLALGPSALIDAYRDALEAPAAQEKAATRRTPGGS